MRNAIVLASDRNFFPAALFVASRLAALNRRSDTDIILFTDSADDVPRALPLARGFKLYQVDAFERELGDLPLRSGITLSSYFRLVIPRLLSETHGRIIYVDADMHPMDGTVFDLFDLPLGPTGVGGVRDVIVHYLMNPDKVTRYLEGLGLSGRRYLNAGFLLIDVPTFLANSTEFRCLALAIEKPRVLWTQDQSALNAVLGGGWTELSPRFNFFYSLHHTVVRAVFGASLVHFSDKPKQWALLPGDPLYGIRTELSDFLARTPWRGFALPASARLPGLAPAQAKPRQALDPVHHDRILRYCFETSFADVEAGITRHLVDPPIV